MAKKDDEPVKEEGVKSKDELLPVNLAEVVKETELAFRLPDDTLVTEKEYLVWLGNQIWEIKKAVA